jgi:hypothetical protein
MEIGRRGTLNEHLLPQGEALRSAVRWLSDQSNGSPLTLKIIEQAAARFDLSPLEEEFLRTHFIPTEDPASR